MDTRKPSEGGAEFFDQLSSMQASESTIPQTNSPPKEELKDPLQDFDQYSDSFLSLIQGTKEAEPKESPKKEPEPKPIPEVPTVKGEETKATLIRPIARKAVAPKKVEEQRAPSISAPPVVNPEELKQLPEQAEKYKREGSLSISNKGVIATSGNTRILFKKLHKLKSDEYAACIKIHKVIFSGALSSKAGLEEVLRSIKEITALKYLPASEKLIWELVGAVVQYNSIDFFSATPQSAGLRQIIVKILEDYVSDNSKSEINEDVKKPEAEKLEVPKEEMSEKTLLELARKGHWMEATMLSQYINPLMYGKIMEMYLEKYANSNPIYTLILLNQTGADQVFALNPNVIKNWHSHLAFLLRNLEFCNKDSLRDFFELLLLKVKDIDHTGFVFLHLLLGIPIQSLQEFYLSLKMQLRTHILLELIHVYWKAANYPASTADPHKLKLLSIYYGKSLAFAEVGYCEYALEALKQVNALKTLGKTWAIYDKLLDLTEMLQNKLLRKPGIREEVEKPRQGKGLISTIASGISGLFAVKAESGPPPQKMESEKLPEQPKFYYDNVKGKWIINGKEADTEYDMGQEPVAPKNFAEVPPPPPTQGHIRPPAQKKEKEQAKKIVDPFNYRFVPKPEVAKNVVNQPKYVNQ